MINGANVSRLLSRSSHAKVFGVDYSPVSVEKSSKVNPALASSLLQAGSTMEITIA